MVIKRLPTHEFLEFRKRETEAERMRKALMGGGEWDKMAIIKIHNESPPISRLPRWRPHKFARYSNCVARTSSPALTEYMKELGER